MPFNVDMIINWKNYVCGIFQVYCNFSSEKFEYKMNNDFICALSIRRKPKKTSAKGKFMLPCTLFRPHFSHCGAILGKRNDDLHLILAASFN